MRAACTHSQKRRTVRAANASPRKDMCRERTLTCKARRRSFQRALLLRGGRLGLGDGAGREVGHAAAADATRQQSLQLETWPQGGPFEILVQDEVRQLKAETLLGASCPIHSTPVLAITGMIATGVG